MANWLGCGQIRSWGSDPEDKHGDAWDFSETWVFNRNNDSISMNVVPQFHINKQWQCVYPSNNQPSYHAICPLKQTVFYTQMQ